MSHLDPQPEDNNDVRLAKSWVSGNLSPGALECRRLMVAALDDRSNWIAKAAEIRDTMIDVTTQFTPGNETERELMRLMAGNIREISAMMENKEKS